MVPSIAVREGVYKTFLVTQEHFAEEYGKKARFSIFDSSKLTEVKRFALDSSINVIIINSQMFNAKGKSDRRIYMELDELNSCRAIDLIEGTNPILIIDEPQSVEGRQTKEKLKEFNPLLTLRYSATHRSDSVYNMVYRLDAVDAYNMHLVKKIAVKGITESCITATDGYVYLESINLSKASPTATIQFDYKSPAGFRKRKMTVGIGFDLYVHSNGMEEYKDGFLVEFIDGRDNHIEFLNGIKVYVGDVIGGSSEDQLRRIQIRETILSHMEREKQLFRKGIKVLSLFFIDEVAKYKQYDAAGRALNGIYADIFEEEYHDIVSRLQVSDEDEAYMAYLHAIAVKDTHAGYFSMDRKGRMIDSRLSDKRRKTSDDIDAYNLIMKNKELLLDCDPRRSPVRFIFSHSALREGWDNPNIFQICTLKQSGSDIRKRQEIGRGLRLCVNQDGERMDAGVLGDDVHNMNILTVIASESYDSFSKSLQREMAEEITAAEGNTDAKVMQLEDARKKNIELKADLEKMAMSKFKTLWQDISAKDIYMVDFDTDELVHNAIESLNQNLHVPELYFKVETGAVNKIKLKDEAADGEFFVKKQSVTYDSGKHIPVSTSVKYDLIGKLMEVTGLTRRAVIAILFGINKTVFEQFKDNPEEFIHRTAALINDEKASVIIQHITYNLLDKQYTTDIFTEPAIKGKMAVDAKEAVGHLVEHAICDSMDERSSFQEKETNRDITVYVKLPKSFYISTPVGDYTPDWAVTFYEGTVKHIFFVAETKGSMRSMQFQTMKAPRASYKPRHSCIIGDGTVLYDIAEGYQALLEKVMQ